jgi:hypothetical protein
MEPSGSQQLLLRHVKHLAAEVAELKKQDKESVSDNLAHWIAAQFVLAAKNAALATETGSLDLKTLSALSADVVALRRGDHSAERLTVERGRLELETEKFKSQSRTKIEAGFDELATELRKNPRAKELFGQLKEEVMKMKTA